MKTAPLSAQWWVRKQRLKLSVKKFKEVASPVCLISIFKSSLRRISSHRQTRSEWHLRTKVLIQTTIRRVTPRLLRSQTLQAIRRNLLVQSTIREPSRSKLIFTPHKFKSKWQIRNYPKKTQTFWWRKTTTILNLQLTKTTKIKSLKRLPNRIEYGLIPGSLCPALPSRYPKTSTNQDCRSILQRRAILTS
jgi:hypothetical protein